MSRVIEIMDKTSGGGTAIHLSDLLLLLGEEGPSLQWTILQLEAWGTDTCPVLGLDLLDLERTIENTSTGYLISWENLNAFAESVEQLIDAVILGCADANKIPELKSDTDLYTPSEVVLELIDGMIWRVYANNDLTFKRFKDTFQDVVVIPLNEFP